MPPLPSPPPAFEIKSASLSLVSLIVRTSNLARIAAELEERLEQTPDFFEDDAVLIDLNGLDAQSEPMDLRALCEALRRYRMNPVAVRGGLPAHLASAEQAGLFVMPEAPHPPSALPAPPAPPPVQEVVREVIKEVPVYSNAMVIDKPLRSGQHIYARGSDLILLAMVNPGAEVMADGNIHVYSTLRGKAFAGAKGNTEARIFTHELDAELVSIAGVYRTSDVPLPPEVRGKPSQIYLRDDKLVMQPL